MAPQFQFPGASFFPRSPLPDLLLSPPSITTGFSFYPPRGESLLFDLQATAPAPSLQNHQSAWQDLGFTLTDSDSNSDCGASPSSTKPTICMQQSTGSIQVEETSLGMLLPPKEGASNPTMFNSDSDTSGVCVGRSRVALLRKEEETTRKRSDSADLFLDCVELLSTKKKHTKHTSLL
jgi:hypothetical protein